MDLSSVDIASYSTAKALTDVQLKAQVNVSSKMNDQAEAVIGKLLEGIEAVSVSATGKGGNLNVKA